MPATPPVRNSISGFDPESDVAPLSGSIVLTAYFRL
jgi:hypothetical protein